MSADTPLGDEYCILVSLFGQQLKTARFRDIVSPTFDAERCECVLNQC